MVDCAVFHHCRENNRGELLAVEMAVIVLSKAHLSASFCVPSVTSNPPHQPLQAIAGFSWMVLRCLATLLGSILYITHSAGYYVVAGLLPVIFLFYEILIFCSQEVMAPGA